MLLLTLFVGCSDKKSEDKVDNKIEGTYKLMTVKGRSPAEFYKDESDEDAQYTNGYYHLDELDEDSLKNLATLTLNKDGTFELVYVDDVIKADSGEWTKEEDGRISFHHRVGQIFYAEFNDGKLTFPEGMHRLHDVELVYRKTR